MKRTEVKTAEALLDGRIDRTETVPDDDGSICLTVHWVDGGQTAFWSLEQIRNHIEIHNPPKDQSTGDKTQEI